MQTAANFGHPRCSRNRAWIFPKSYSVYTQKRFHALTQHILCLCDAHFM